jgi:hypothetical protein
MLRSKPEERATLVFLRCPTKNLYWEEHLLWIFFIERRLFNDRRLPSTESSLV